MRLLHRDARHEALRPLAGHHRVPALQHRSPHPGPALLARAGLPPRLVPGGQRGRDRDGRGAHGRAGLAARLGARAPRDRLQLLLLPPRSVGQLQPSTTSTSTTSRRPARGSRATSRPRIPSTCGARRARPTSARTRKGVDLEFLHALVQPGHHQDRALLARRPRRPAPPRDGQERAGDRAHPQPARARRPLRVRPAAPRGPRHHPGQRARPPRPLRLRSPALSGGAGRARGPRHRLRAAGGRRGRARELLHGGRARQHHRPPGRAHQHRGLRPPRASGCARSASTASSSSSSR